MDRLQDIDPLETREWVDSLEAVLEIEGPERAHFLLEQLVDKARRSGAYLPYRAHTAYINTIPPHLEERMPGDARARGAAALVRALERGRDGAARGQEGPRAGRPHRELRLGGHALRRGLQPFLERARPRTTAATSSTSRATPRPASTRAPTSTGGSPRRSSTCSARRSTARASRRYPHPWLMPDFWQFPTVSMGLGPIQAIYQARFLHYLNDRGLAKTDGPQGVGVHGRRRDGRARVARRDRHGLAREPRQPDLRRQLQPAAPRRPGARQRQDHPGARGRLPRRRLERDQGDLGLATGTRCSRATRTACC